MCWDDLETAPHKKTTQTTWSLWSLLNNSKPPRDLPCLGFKIPKQFPISSHHPIIFPSQQLKKKTASIRSIHLQKALLPSFVQQVSAVASAPFRRYWPAAPSSAAPPRSYAPGSACARGVVAMQPFVGSWSPPRTIKIIKDQLWGRKKDWIMNHHSHLELQNKKQV